MRTGGCAVQQALTPEAAAIVTQAVALAKRRGHAQVTPLHVANTMLAAPTGLLRAACQQSHSHPLQCKALELCFNVALNRLPTGSPGSFPMLSNHSQQYYPSISNALVAAFKRAQAHHRRGSVENQPQLIPKIELEQLVISILDDPSVSRVMREAGFSSPQVKNNVEKVVSLEPPQTSKNEITITSKNDDVSIIIESLLTSRKRRSLVIVGESISKIETTVKELMDRVDRGINVPEDLREVKFISIPPLYSFCDLQRHLVEQKMGELFCLVKSLVSKGVVLYLGDLNWISEYRVRLEKEGSYYCSVEHMIMEIGRLINGGIGENINGKFWVMGIANFQTYMRCRNGFNSLEDVWRLSPVTIPADSLGLSLISDQSDEHSEARHGREENGSCRLLLTHGEVKLNCCADCSSKFEAEAKKLENSCDTNDPKLSNLPPWLKDESTRLCNNDQNCDSIIQLSKKWNSFCNSSAHKQPKLLEITLTLSSSSPPSSISCFSIFDQHNPNPQQNTFSSNPNSTHNSPTTSDITETCFPQNFKEFSAQNLNTLCNALEKKVPWQREIIPEIAGTILQCRSGMLRRKNKITLGKTDIKEETWLLFLGPDVKAKEKISRHLAKVVFGSYSNFVSIGISGFISSARSDNSSEDYYYRNKRGRDEENCSIYVDRFANAMCVNPHRVFFLDDLEQADYFSQMGIKRAIERGRIRNNENGEEVSFCDAIIVLSCERFRSRSSRACSPCTQKLAENGGGVGEEETMSSDCGPLDLNISFDDESVVDGEAIDDLGILKNVDRCVVFKFQNL